MFLTNIVGLEVAGVVEGSVVGLSETQKSNRCIKCYGQIDKKKRKKRSNRQQQNDSDKKKKM